VAERATSRRTPRVAHRASHTAYSTPCVAHRFGLLLIAIEHCIIVIDQIEHLSQKVGVTTTLPDVVHHTLLWNNARPQEWNYVGSLLWHNRQKLATDLPSLHGLHLDQKIGLLLWMVIFMSTLMGNTSREWHLDFLLVVSCGEQSMSLAVVPKSNLSY